jgi:hypothetical protein
VIANLERNRPTRGQMLPLLFDPGVRRAAVPVLAAAAAAVWAVLRRRRARAKRGGPGREGGV